MTKVKLLNSNITQKIELIRETKFSISKMKINPINEENSYIILRMLCPEKKLIF